MFPKALSKFGGILLLIGQVTSPIHGAETSEVASSRESSTKPPSLRRVFMGTNFEARWTIEEADMNEYRIEAFAKRLIHQPDPISEYISNRLSSTCIQNLKNFLQYRTDQDVVERLAAPETFEFSFSVSKRTRWPNSR